MVPTWWRLNKADLERTVVLFGMEFGLECDLELDRHG
jgi:hypothetical protein